MIHRRKCNVQVGDNVVTGTLVRRGAKNSRVSFSKETIATLPDDLKRTDRGDGTLLVDTSNVAVMKEEAAPAEEPAEVVS